MENWTLSWSKLYQKILRVTSMSSNYKDQVFSGVDGEDIAVPRSW